MIMTQFMVPFAAILKKYKAYIVILSISIGFYLFFQYSKYSRSIGNDNTEFGTAGYVASQKSFDEKEYLCSFMPNELSSLIWSHRAHYSHMKSFPDGSRNALYSLLTAGITNFDIDITYKYGEFYVAHPSAADSFPNRKSWSENFLTVSAFLARVAKHHRITPLLLTNNTNNNLRPFFTMEPKFGDDTVLWTRFISILQTCDVIPPNHLAIIVNSPNQLSFIESVLTSYSEFPSISIAIAFRSIPKSEHDYSWDNHVAGKGKNKNDICCFLPQNPTKYRHILMPDVKLLPKSFINLRQRAPINPLYESKVISWLVDSNEDLIQALLQKIDGVVSNEPVKLLHFLQDKYKKYCVSSVNS
jgi:hypothetical protein